jgi:hypothetical protein
MNSPFGGNRNFIFTGPENAEISLYDGWGKYMKIRKCHISEPEHEMKRKD